KRKDFGIFISGNITRLMGFNLRGGIRYTFADTRAFSDDVYRTRSTNSPSLFLGIVKKFSDKISLFFNTGTSFRNPSLSESYYTGITGRKYVTGNPDLDPEKSLNIDTGIKLHSGNLFLGFYMFQNNIKDMIERYRIENGSYTYNNIDSGKISGAETEFQWFPSPNLELFSHFNYYYGRSVKTDDPLNDIPSPKLFAGGKVNLGKSWLEMNLLHSFKKTDPGPSEIENNSYNLVTIKGGHYFSSKFFAFIKISNILNNNFFPNPDPDIPENDGINITAGMNFFF
ncbi:MAG: TonB-dependent receptor, partial [Acidobacteriota bacterium]